MTYVFLGAGMLYLWPRNEAAMAAGKAEVVALTTTRVFDFAGSSWEHTASNIDGNYHQQSAVLL